MIELLSHIVEENTQIAFYDLPYKQRAEAWDRYNQAANDYLRAIQFSIEPINYATTPKDYKMTRHCDRCQKETTWLLRLHPTRGTVLACGLCWERESLHIAALVWKLERVKTEETKYCIDKVIGWANERQYFSQLSENIEGWQMGFDYDMPEWRGYSAAQGVVTADFHKPY